MFLKILQQKTKYIILGIVLALALYVGNTVVRAQESISPEPDISVTPTDVPSDSDSNYFLKISGVEGESKDIKHKGEIDVQSFSWGETNPGSNFGGDQGGGKVNMQDFHFVMKYNKASPKLFIACAQGAHFPEALFTLRKAGGDQQEYLKWKLTDVMCKSYETNGSNPEIPNDSFSLSFTKIEVEYKAQKADGTLDVPIKEGWDLQKNQKF